MGDAVPQTPWDLSLSFSRMDVFALLQTAPAVQSRGLIGRQGDAGMRPERRFKSGMDGGLNGRRLGQPASPSKDGRNFVQTMGSTSYQQSKKQPGMIHGPGKESHGRSCLLNTVRDLFKDEMVPDLGRPLPQEP
jgi:hypothetical protein